MSLSLDDLLARGNAGDVAAQRELAVRFHNGDGVQQNDEAARAWLGVAASNGDAWSQRMLGDLLNVARNRAEAAHWYSLAAAQADAEARFMLGCLQFQGEGVEVDHGAAIVNFVMAALSGHEQAGIALEKLPPLSPEYWASISSSIKWADLTFFMGKSAAFPAPGGVAPFQTDEDWESNDSLWLKYEREAAAALFLSQPCSLDGVFGTPVTVRKLDVQRTISQGEKVFAISISLGDILQSNGMAVSWKPSTSALDDLSFMLAAAEGRRWIRCLYTSY